MATTERITASEARARVLLDNAANWSRGTATLPNGEAIGIVLFASGTRPGVVYMTRCDGRGCSCPAAQRSRSGQCCHQTAVAREAQVAREAAARKPLVSYEQIAERFGLVDAF